MTIRPLADRILLERLEAETQTAGGIVLPDTAKEKSKQGRVLRVGEGKLLDNGTRTKAQVRKGDRVLFTSYAGTEIKLNGKDFLIVNESDILAVIEA